MECCRWVGGQRSEEAESGPSWRPPVASNPKRPRFSLTGKAETERVNLGGGEGGALSVEFGCMIVCLSVFFWSVICVE